MKKFEVFKDYIITNATMMVVCAPELERAVNSKDYDQLLQVIKDNANWCYNNNLIDADILEKYVDDDVLLRNGIYVKKENIAQTEGEALYYNSTSEHYGNSTSEHYGNSTSEHYDNSTSEHYGNSTSKHYYNSTSEHYGNSTSEHYYNSTSKHYGKSTSKHYDNSTSKHYGKSTSEHYGGNSYGCVSFIKDKSIVQDGAIVREIGTKRIYFKKSQYEIIEL